MAWHALHHDVIGATSTYKKMSFSLRNFKGRVHAPELVESSFWPFQGVGQLPFGSTLEKYVLAFWIFA